MGLPIALAVCQSWRMRATVLCIGALGAAIALTTTGCSSTGQSISGTWELVKASDSSGTFDLSGLDVTLRIDGAKSGGQGPCNGYGVQFDGTTTGQRVVTPGASTAMGCIPSSRNALDQRFFAVLAGPMTAKIKHNELVLVGHEGTLAFRRDDAG
jgi:heat shock protein HslJ